MERYSPLMIRKLFSKVINSDVKTEQELSSIEFSKYDFQGVLMDTKNDDAFKIGYLQQVAAAPNLFFAAGSGILGDTVINGTGVATSKPGAVARCRAEAAEAKAIFQSGRHICSRDDSATATGGQAFGSSAATSVGIAIERATYEAIERLAIANWWAGTIVPKHPSGRCSGVFEKTKIDWQRQSNRIAVLLDLTPEYGLPVFVAWSANPRGFEFLLGAACHQNTTTAVSTALKELIQMETGLEIIKFRTRHGVDLSDKEAAILARSRALNIGDCKPLLRRKGHAASYPTPKDITVPEQFDRYFAHNNITFQREILPKLDAVHYVVYAHLMHRDVSGNTDDVGKFNDAHLWRSWAPY